MKASFMLLGVSSMLGGGGKGVICTHLWVWAEPAVMNKTWCKAPHLLLSSEKVVSSEALDGVPILVLANKQDVEVSPTKLL